MIHSDAPQLDASGASRLQQQAQATLQLLLEAMEEQGRLRLVIERLQSLDLHSTGLAKSCSLLHGAAAATAPPSEQQLVAVPAAAISALEQRVAVAESEMRRLVEQVGANSLSVQLAALIDCVTCMLVEYSRTIAI
jgi:hypothetical protein